LDCGYRVDLIVADVVVVEVKVVDRIARVHEAQLLTYLRLGGWKVGLLINFNVALLRDGIRRRVLGLEESQLSRPGRAVHLDHSITAETRRRRGLAGAM
jgi:hypothetical protein